MSAFLRLFFFFFPAVSYVIRGIRAEVSLDLAMPSIYIEADVTASRQPFSYMLVCCAETTESCLVDRVPYDGVLTVRNRRRSRLSLRSARPADPPLWLSVCFIFTHPTNGLRFLLDLRCTQ